MNTFCATSNIIGRIDNVVADHRIDFSRGTTAPNELQHNANTPLLIGVIGQIFSGKHCLINTLLFDGAPLPPMRITPELVHLTRIVYGERPRLTVHYYTHDEWTALERLATSADEGMEAGVAREIIKIAQRADIDIAACLAHRTEIVEASTMAEFFDRINDYVGIKGRYTGLVESVEFALPLDELLGIEVVDTPAINDPVIGRMQKTHDYLARCDVVFCLSSASRFLTEIDMDLVRLQLPAKGVKRLILVATHLGPALSDECQHFNSSLTDGERTLKERLTHRAHEMFECLAAQREQRGCTDLAALLRASAMPIYMCGYMHTFATQPQENWDRGHHSRYQEFVFLADYVWGGQLPTPTDWQRLSGFDVLHEALVTIRTDKKS